MIKSLILMLSVLPSLAVAQAAPKPDPALLFDPIASVLLHPRCLNCHQPAVPTQRDTGIAHAQRIVRGVDGHGAPALRCASCHQAKNSADGLVPGALHWHLAPTSMSWAGLSKQAVCEQIKDPARNGQRTSPEQVIDHMARDPLVLWAWQPGAGRSTPPIPHDAFLAALRRWAAEGMPCPRSAS